MDTKGEPNPATQSDFGGGERRAPGGKPRTRKSFVSSLWSSFVAGVVVVAPIGITIALIYWFVTDPMAKVDRFVRGVLPGTETTVIPGLGVVIAFLAIIAAGYFAKNFIGRAFIKAGQEILEAVPIVRQLYKFFRNVFETALQQKERSFKEVCLVEYPKDGLWALAFVVGDGKGEVVKALAGEFSDPLSVFVPTVPNPTSGFCIFVSRSKAKFLKMSVEDAAKFVFSLGLVVPEFVDGDEAVRRLDELAKTARDKKPFQLHLPGRNKSKA